MSSEVYSGFMRMCLAWNISPFLLIISMIWNPSGVSTIFETIPGFRAIAASENEVQKTDLFAIPRSPPRRALLGSCEYRRAKVEKRSPATILSRMPSSFSFAANLAASLSG